MVPDPLPFVKMLYGTYVLLASSSASSVQRYMVLRCRSAEALYSLYFHSGTRTPTVRLALSARLSVTRFFSVASPVKMACSMKSFG